MLGIDHKNAVREQLPGGIRAFLKGSEEAEPDPAPDPLSRFEAERARSDATLHLEDDGVKPSAEHTVAEFVSQRRRGEAASLSSAWVPEAPHPRGSNCWRRWKRLMERSAGRAPTEDPAAGGVRFRGDEI